MSRRFCHLLATVIVGSSGLTHCLAQQPGTGNPCYATWVTVGQVSSAMSYPDPSPGYINYKVYFPIGVTCSGSSNGLTKCNACITGVFEDANGTTLTTDNRMLPGFASCSNDWNGSYECDCTDLTVGASYSINVTMTIYNPDGDNCSGFKTGWGLGWQDSNTYKFIATATN